MTQFTVTMIHTWCIMSFSDDMSQSPVLWSEVKRNTSFNRIAWRFSLAVRLTSVCASNFNDNRAKKQENKYQIEGVACAEQTYVFSTR